MYDYLYGLLWGALSYSFFSAVYILVISITKTTTRPSRREEPLHMDTILSLPLLSVFFLPAVTSWSTSLNVLFFYLTWSTLLFSHSALKVEFIATLIVRTACFLIPSWLFFLFDVGIPSLAKNTKHHGKVAIATSSRHGGTGRSGKWWRVLLWSFVNVVLGVAVQTAIAWFFTKVLHTRSRLKVQTTLPLPWSIVKDVTRGLVMREFFGYLLHRYALHNSYSPLAGVHRSWYHSLPATYSLTAHYDHPLAYLVRVWLPTYLPAAIFRYHLLTYHAFIAIVSLEELFVYSGYSYMPLSVLLVRLARRQELHLMAGAAGRAGNFSPYGFADLLAGTSMGTDVIDDLREEIERDEVPEKLKSRAKKATRQVKGRRDKSRRMLRGEEEEEEE